MKWNKLFAFNLLFLSLYLFAYPISLLANPEGAQIEAGSAIISDQQEGERLNQELNITQTSEKAIINWDKFSIQEGEITNFVLPSSSSSTLNRVTGGSLTEIYGTLKSNGDLLLINPQGVMIGPNGLVDVGGFLASTYNLKNEAFLNDQQILKFEDLDNSPASIINEGQVIARDGDILLIAKDLDNKGFLTAEKGEVNLKGGCEITLLPNEENKIKVRLKKTGSVRNSGTIKAIKAELEAAGGIPECLAVSNEGVIEALGIGEKDGKLVLLSDEEISVSGTLIANNEVQKETQDKQVNSSDSSATLGGKIYLLGDTINLEKGAVINASGDLGGGEVLIGGDFQGKNPEIKNASLVYMDKDAVVHADALKNGNGGKVILWSEKATNWQGLTTAKGGSESGDGGFVEVSSHGFLNPKGRFDALASTGKNGELFLDPSNITITAAASVPAWANPYNPGPGEANPSNVDVADLIGAAGLAGGNVTISTSNGDQGLGDITVSTAIASASGNSLTLTADNNITISANTTVTGNLVLNFDQADSGANFAVGSGITLSSANTSLVGSNVSSSSSVGLAGPAATTVTMTGANAGSISGAITIDSFTNINTIKATNHADDMVIGANVDSAWTITSDNIRTWTPTGGGSTTFSSFQNLTGGSGTDNFIFDGAFRVSGLINGGSGTNTITGPNVTNAWAVTGDNAGTLTPTGASGATAFSNMQNLTGGSGTDGFTFNGAFRISSLINGGAGTNTLTAPSNTTTWSIGSNNNGSLTPTGASGTTTFSNMQNLVGIANANVITWIGPAAVTATVTGVNAVSLVGGSTNISFTNVQSVIASGHADDTLVGPAGGQTFNIQDDASGGNITGFLNSFASFPKLTGGSGDDSFIFADSGILSGIQNIYIEGGSGSNTLDVSYFQPDSSYYTRSTYMSLNEPNEGRCYLTKRLLLNDNTFTTVWFTNVGTIEGAQVTTTLNVYDDGALSGLFHGHTNNGSTDYQPTGLPYTRLDYEQVYEEVTLDLTNNSMTRLNGGQANGFSNVQAFSGNYYGPKGYVILPNDAEAVYLVDRDGLTVQRATEFFRIGAFDKYYGGSGNDTFRFTEDSFSEIYPSFTETLLLDGGGGTNAFDFRSLTELPDYYFDRGSGYISTTNNSGEIITINFSNINYFYLPGVFLTWFDFARIQIITTPESSIIANSEDKGINLTQGNTLPTEADILFIIKDLLHPGEIGGGTTAIPLTFNTPEELTSQHFASFIGEKYFAAKTLDPLFKVRLAKLSDTELELVAKNCQFYPVPEIKL